MFNVIVNARPNHILGPIHNRLYALHGLVFSCRHLFQHSGVHNTVDLNIVDLIAGLHHALFISYITDKVTHFSTVKRFVAFRTV